eukprot:SAG11_NODE_9577_length_899_cov_1.201250_1_plen_87_part_00
MARMLTVDATARIDAAAILNDPWIMGNVAPSPQAALVAAALSADFTPSDAVPLPTRVHESIRLLQVNVPRPPRSYRSCCRRLDGRV